jgi:predicted glycosyltransferase
MVVALADLDEEIAPEELAEMGSLNHGYLQLKIGAYFLTIPDLTPTSEFALDTSVLSTLGMLLPSSLILLSFVNYRSTFKTISSKAKIYPFWWSKFCRHVKVCKYLLISSSYTSHWVYSRAGWSIHMQKRLRFIIPPVSLKCSLTAISLMMSSTSVCP